MGARAWEEMSDEEIDQLRDDLADAQGARAALEEERDRLLARIEKLEDRFERAMERVEGLVAEPLDFQDAAHRLLELLDRQLGVERYDESVDVHDLFSAMRDLRDATSEAAEVRRCHQLHALLNDDGRPNGNKEDRKNDAPQGEAP